MDALRDVDEAVLVAAGNVEQFNCFRAAAGSGTSSAPGLVFGADEKPPTHANVSRWPSPKFSDLPAAHRKTGDGALLRDSCWPNTSPESRESSSRADRSNFPEAGGVLR